MICYLRIFYYAVLLLLLLLLILLFLDKIDAEDTSTGNLYLSIAIVLISSNPRMVSDLKSVSL